MSVPFRDPDLPLEARLDDLLGRLTLAERVSLLHQHQPAIPRLGLAAFHTGAEALHGAAWLGTATVFPQAVGLASTWSPELALRVGAAVGDEMRGLHHRDPTVGLNVWAPVVNLLRHPLWGRNEEGLSEDPLLTGAISTAYAHGLRGHHPRYLRTAPTLKHFLAYNREDDRDTTSMSVRPRVLREYELPAFRAALADGAATAIMPSYNLVNGRPAHLSPLIDEARSWTREELLVCSDAFAPSNIVERQHYVEDHAQGHAAALRAGVDSFTDQGEDPSLTVRSVEAALARGLITERDVDRAVRRTLSIRFRLGELDPPDRNPYAGITDAVIDRPAHRLLAREAACRAMVLLKNEGSLLPLIAPCRVAVIGPLADVLFEDWYSGTMPYRITPLGGIAERVGPGGQVEGREGVDRIELEIAETGAPWGAGAVAVVDWGQGVCTFRTVEGGRYLSVTDAGQLVAESLQPRAWVVTETFRLLPCAGDTLAVQNVASGRYLTVSPETGGLAATATTLDAATRFRARVLSSGVDEAVAAARAADVAVVVVGNAPCINGKEAEDRADIRLPAGQERLVRAVLAANPRTVLVVESSYPMAITWADEHVPAILWTSHGGQETGRALADVLFGDHPPAGRLTQTWYRSADDLPDMRDYDIIRSRATYLYFDGSPLYPFGHGLTYAAFHYDDLRLSAPVMEAGGLVTVSVAVTNTGRVASEEVVQLYTRQRGSRVEQPLRQLRGFRRERFRPGETRIVRFALRAASLATWDVTSGRFVVEAGALDVMVGRSSAAIEAAAELRVAGETIPPRRVTAVETRAADFDDCSGVELVDESRRCGDAVAPVGGHGWIAFREVDFGAGVGTVSSRVSSAGPGAAAIQLWLDDPAGGRLAGTIEVPRTGGHREWATVAAAVQGAEGVHDLYLVLAGDARLASFTFQSR